MSSVSNTSWCTAADSSSNESIKFIDDVGGEGSKSRVSYVVDSDRNTKKHTQHCRILLKTNEQIKEKAGSNLYRGCFGKGLKLVHEIKEYYTWKVPWIIILLSVVQVCTRNCRISASVLLIKTNFLFYSVRSGGCLLCSMQCICRSSYVQSTREIQSLALLHILFRTFQFNTLAVECCTAGRLFVAVEMNFSEFFKSDRLHFERALLTQTVYFS